MKFEKQIIVVHESQVPSYVYYLTPAGSEVFQLCPARQKVGLFMQGVASEIREAVRLQMSLRGRSR